jgi:transposase-like protein
MEERQRRSFTDDYQRQAVDLVASRGRSIGSVAKNLVCAIPCCGGGWGQAGADGGVAPHLSRLITAASARAAACLQGTMLRTGD